MIPFSLHKYEKSIRSATLALDLGKVSQVTGFLIRGYLPGAVVGGICEIHPMTGDDPFLAEVVGFEGREVLLMPLGEMQGVGLGSKIVLLRTSPSIRVSSDMLGRVLNAMGEPMDGGPEIFGSEDASLYVSGVNPLKRPPIHEPVALGVRAIDGLLTIGKGQRVGIMAGSGVGKSILMGMMARAGSAEVNVIALVGERGREVREFIEHTLGAEGLSRSVLVVATSDQSPLLRMRASFVASAIAEYFCHQGRDVLLMMDSVTRFAMAQREIGLNVGEPPASKGYTPSVFSWLPKLLERAGNYEGHGSITGLYTVLVEGDDMDDPIGDAVRSIVDGHIVLSRALAHKGHFPAVDVLQSTSRVMRNVVDREHLQAAMEIREVLATYKEAEDLINIGAYKAGSNAQIDRAVRLHPIIERFLRQDISESTDFSTTETFMSEILAQG